MKDKILYLEAYSGISGDMTVSALLDMGGDEKLLMEVLESLNIEGYKVEIGRRQKCGIDGAYFNVILEEKNHHHSQDHFHDDHKHIHRGLKEIRQIIEDGNLTDKAKELALKIFEKIAEAEAKAHNIAKDEVHFHEVGAVDSIVDIVSVAFLIDNLGIERTFVSKLYEGSGHVKCAHGRLPVPVPAVANILSAEKLDYKITTVEGEMITPTGAAIAATLKTEDSLPENYTIEQIGIGTGSKDFDHANILRAYLLSPKKKLN